MTQLPQDPMMLFSVINTKLRDYYSSLDALCEDLNVSREELEKLADLSLYQDQEAYEEVCRQAVQKAIGQTKAQAI